MHYRNDNRMGQHMNEIGSPEGSAARKRILPVYSVPLAVLLAAAVFLIVRSDARSAQDDACGPPGAGCLTASRETINPPRGPGWHTVARGKSKVRKGVPPIAGTRAIQILNPPKHTRIKITTRPSGLEVDGGGGWWMDGYDWFINCIDEPGGQEVLRFGWPRPRKRYPRSPWINRIKLPKKTPDPYLCRYWAGAALHTKAPKVGTSLKVVIQVKK